MCFVYDEAPEFASERIVVGRKEHRCHECRGAIAAGERHEHVAGKFDGEFFSMRRCRRCCYDTIRVVEHEYAEGCADDEAWPPWGGLVEYLAESGMGQTDPADVPASFQAGDRPRRPAPGGMPA